jgi:squalene-associated FAD-dependent desaturase
LAGNGRRVVVVGAGLAGASAAWDLAGRGFKVILLERNSSAGGRAGSAPDPETGEVIDSGQHLLMGCYSSTMKWLRELGTAGLVRFQERLEVSYASNPAVVFRARRLPPPLNLLAGIMGVPGMTTGLLLKTLRLGRALFSGRSLDGMTVAEWLDRLGIPVPVRRWVLDPLSLAAVNEQPEIGSAYPMVRVMRRLSRWGGKWSALGWATAGLGDLYLGPVKKRVEDAGGEVRFSAEVNGIMVEDGKVSGVRMSGGGEVEADAVVLALPPWDLPKVLEGIPSCSSISGNAGKLKPSPILTVHLWLDTVVLGKPLMGLVSGPFDWVFNLSHMIGPARKGMQHVCLLRSGAREMLGRKPVELEEMALDCLRRSFPGAGPLQVVHRRVIWETKATVSLTPGTNALRPGARTPVQGLVLAGGWTATGFPDTIESAVISGRRAAGSVE